MSAVPERTAEVRSVTKHLEFHLRRFGELKRGDIFRLREADGRLVDGGRLQLALSDTYLNKHNVLTIDCEPYVRA